MGFFTDGMSIYKKSEAAVVVQNLLERQARVGLLDVDPNTLANRLVSLVWDQKPDLFDGKFGQRPHKISIAAAALANGIDQFKRRDTNRGALIIALGTVLAEIETNGRLYSLTGVDHTLIEAAGLIFMEMSNEDKNQMSPRVTKEKTYSSFDDWYAEFKTAAGNSNPQLQQTDGKCLLDFMDHTPLRRAFRDGVEPRQLALEFAKSFDIHSFFNKGR